MSIIAFTTKTVAGSMSKVQTSAKIRVSKSEEAQVVLSGYIGAPRVKQGDGQYKASAYGRLPLQAALTGTGDKQRYVLEIAGGLRGVLFKAKQSGENSPDYMGNIDLGGGMEMALFGRKVSNDGGDFISLSSGEAKPAQPRGNGGSQQSEQHAPDFSDDDGIPF